MKSNEKGFNLIELMIVMAIIAILISVSVYSWQVMVRRGNEAAAVTHITKINTAQAYYASKHGGVFADGFEQLVQLDLLSDEFRQPEPVVDGYRFEIATESSPARSYSVIAAPAITEGISASGVTNYYLDSESHTIRYTDEPRVATGTDKPL